MMHDVGFWRLLWEVAKARHSAHQVDLDCRKQVSEQFRALKLQRNKCMLIDSHLGTAHLD